MVSEIMELYENLRKDGGMYWSFVLSDGERYSVFDAKLGPILEKGKTYEFTVVKKGQFKNILKAELIIDVNAEMKEPEPEFVTGIKENPQETPPEKSIETIAPVLEREMQSQCNPNSREEAIARSVALKSASSWLNAVESSAEGVVETAQRFYSYLITGE